MAFPDADDFKLTVLSPGGRDLEQYFDDAVEPDSPAHPPVNFHAFAACTRGAFHRDVKARARRKGAGACFAARRFQSIAARADGMQKGQKRTVVVSFKETGLHQIAQQLSDRKGFPVFCKSPRKLMDALPRRRKRPEFSGKLAANLIRSRSLSFPRHIRSKRRQWNMSIQPDKQSGIFIGTREWDVPSRNHAAAVLMARQTLRSDERTGDRFQFRWTQRQRAYFPK